MLKPACYKDGIKMYPPQTIHSNFIDWLLLDYKKNLEHFFSKNSNFGGLSKTHKFNFAKKCWSVLRQILWTNFRAVYGVCVDAFVGKSQKLPSSQRFFLFMLY